MTLTEVIIGAMQKLARENSDGPKIDKYWEIVLPEVLDFMANEVFLTLHRLFINESMKQSAFRLAQTVPPRDTEKLDNATLTLHCLTREALWSISDDSGFQALVDRSHGIICNTADSIRWVKPSHVWLPHTYKVQLQIHRSLIERYKHAFFARRCYAEVVRRGRQNKYLKCVHVLLTDSDEFRQQQNEATKWLRAKSRSIVAKVGIDSNVGEDLLQNQFIKLLRLPWHEQVQRAGATKKAIRDGAIDLQRKGGQYEEVPLDDEHINAIPDDATYDTIEGMIADQFPKRILARQSQIEEILSEGKPDLGERRFMVLLKLSETPQNEIAKQLNTSEPTITRDKMVIRQKWEDIKDLL